LAYTGRFTDALDDFYEAVDLFTQMDDEVGLLSVYLLLAWEYNLPLQQWAAAHTHLQQAQEIIERQPDTLPEETARALMGLGYVLVSEGRYGEAERLYQQAAGIIEDKDLCWWRPALYYFTGLVKSAQRDPGQARLLFQKAAAVTGERGCPDYLGLVLLELARLEPRVKKKEQLLEQCIEAANARARHLDRITCLQAAGEMLQTSQDSRRRYLGEQALRQAERWEARLKTARIRFSKHEPAY
jgi:tetratricopeptide (TPR) repeat protein